ncbi:TPA: ead/Ea22-like family protein [Salmonella enterica subsp. enterica serovar 1,4,[5],12:i:-]|uniref:ead/Ea22-like family protein n=1 Tax=Salmonella enterica TaxID=28901 RepID=UPI000BE30069|nr:ead/Ea22-like family protein [Escherichia coli]EBE0293121.1 ead/Ea22-like family protein [Salmonella enterica]ECG9410025.1 ead/Ea22-like family protein [Salmonella enterica]ECI3991939.1 ead/Ea22-like family protein [Salmonella enterica subsp. enterica]
MSETNYQELREAAEKATWGDWDSYKPHRGARGYEVRLSSQAIAQHVLKNNAEFIAAFNPKVALALLDERERNQQYIKSRDQENEEIALTVGKLRVELEAAKKRIAELKAEPVSQTYKLPPLSSNEVNDAAWKLHNMLTEHGPLNGRQFNNLKGCFYEALKVAMRNYPVTPDSSAQAPGKGGFPGERIRIKPHVYRELVNRLHDTAIKCAGTQQLRERISRVLGEVITPDRHKQAEKSGLERSHLEAALNIKPGHTLGVIDAMLVHEMARALLPLVAEKHEADHANES